MKAVHHHQRRRRCRHQTQKKLIYYISSHCFWFSNSRNFFSLLSHFSYSTPAISMHKPRSHTRKSTHKRRKKHNFYLSVTHDDFLLCVCHMKNVNFSVCFACRCMADVYIRFDFFCFYRVVVGLLLLLL